MMEDSEVYSRLVAKAKLGDRVSLEKLAELVRGRLYAYVYRIVMAEDEAQDVVQESLLEMFKVLGNLRRDDRFWPWLRAIAFNKIRLSVRKQRRQRTLPLSALGDGWPLPGRSDGSEEGLAKLTSQELRELIFNAMRQLKPKQRAVLAMRCYEEMNHSQIAELMGCSELNARVLFCRAKKALHMQLSRAGLRKEFLLTALIIFGKMTAPSEAVAAGISITAAALEAGLFASILAALAGRTTLTFVKAAGISITAAGMFIVGSMVVPRWTEKAISWAERQVEGVREQVAETFKPAGPVEQYEENWYYYPVGVDGPVMMRVVECDAGGKRSYCRQMQNEEANYHYDKGTNTIYINNSRMWRSDLSVRRLPGDGAELREFLSKGGGEAMEYIRGDGGGLLVIVNAEQGEPARTIHHDNLLDEEYFRYSWPAGVRIVDNRDQMHKRGWTYLRVSGRIGSEEVSGAGRIPFVYSESKAKAPWLRLQVGEDLRIEDFGANAYVYDAEGKVEGRYKAGSFFAGLSRPWMGLHTIDSVRRDAAEQQLWFETVERPRAGKVEVIITCEEGKLIYTIDMQRDVVEKIEFSLSDGQGRDAEGELLFSYLQDVDYAGREFASPRERHYRRPQEEGVGILWLVKLARGELAK